MTRPRVLLADDHRIVAEGLRLLLEPEFDLVGIVEDGRQLIEAAARLRPDVIVVDVTMPHVSGLDALPRLKAELPGVKIVFLTMHGELAYARRALAGGADGFVVKHSATGELVLAIRAALAGKSYVTPLLGGSLLTAPAREPGNGRELTARQREILELLAHGNSAKEIASVLGISARTAEFHKYRIMETLGLHTNAELIHFAIKHGIVSI